jgi:Immunoglobulin domain
VLAVWLLALIGNELSAQPTNSRLGLRPGLSIVPLFTNNPGAMLVITNLLQTPSPMLTVPTVSQSGGTSGTFWTLKGAPVPLPFNPYPDLPVYQISTNHEFLIDNRSVDYEMMAELEALEAIAFGATNQTFTGCATCALDETGLLWLEVPADSLATPDYFTVALHHTVPGQAYDILTKPNLLAPWVTELVVTGAVGNITPVAVTRNTYTNKFVRARTSMAYSFYLLTPPLSQNVLAGDTVTFYVETGGNTNLTFQWTFNGSAIAGATNSSYTINLVRGSDAGEYACIISDGTRSLTTAPAQLNVLAGTGYLNYMRVVGARQNYTFKSGLTYYLYDQIPFYGHTTIEAGAVIKPDWYANAGLVIMGTLACRGEPYFPAVITSVDDDSIGVSIGVSQEDPPLQALTTGVPYLELACAKSSSIRNLRIKYADWGVTTPIASRRLEVWDCQFVDCNYALVNLVPGSSTNSLHNVLLAICGAAVGAATNAITVEAEQVTADAQNLCVASVLPSRIALTNCLLWGNPPAATSLSLVQVVRNPSHTNFTASGAGIYYLTAQSPLHQAGHTNISLRLQSSLKDKTTYAPLAFPPFTAISGSLTLSPQAPRYTNGAPDLGYYYDALDYTLAELLVNHGNVTVLPGTAIGFRLEQAPANQLWTLSGCILGNNASFISRGQPGRPCTFVDVQQVQEQFQWPVPVAFVPNFFPSTSGDQPPVLDFRFAHFYAGYISYYERPAYHVWSGQSVTGWQWSFDSALDFTLQDCQLRGGQLDLGPPDNVNQFGVFNYDTLYGASAVTWRNTVFDDVRIYLNPTYYWLTNSFLTNQVMNCDLRVVAEHNLFKNSLRLMLYPVPATAGNWLFRDNVFDRVQVYQVAGAPLDFEHNGYWPLTGAEMLWGIYGYTNKLQATATSDGLTEVFLTNAPPYQAGPYGSYYLTKTTALYQAGSRTAAAAGLTEYTTFANQTKDPSNQPVNIGLHYVAATNNSSLITYNSPLDSDSDGVPDYVEVEHGTDLHNPMTDGVTNDTYNVAYDDVDLDGDGLMGRAENALFTNPLMRDNPLTLSALTQLNSLRGVVMIPLAISSNIDAHASLILRVDGLDAGGQIAKTTNGWLATWDTTTTDNGFHVLDIQYVFDDRTDGAANGTTGGSALVNMQNPLTFEEVTRDFTDSLNINAKVFTNAGAYRIEVYDAETQAHLKTLAGDFANGLIQTNWSVLDDQGGRIVTNGLRCDFYLDAPSASSANSLLTLPLGPISILYRLIDHICCRQNFTVAWGFSDYTGNNSSSAMNAAMLHGVVNNLNTLFDWYGDDTDYSLLPGVPNGANANVPYTKAFRWVMTASHADRNEMLAALGSGANFYWWGHGKPKSFSPGEFSPGEDYPIYASELATNLGNINGNHARHPYNLVILDCCYGYSRDLANAFGMSFDKKGNNYTKDDYQNILKRDPQAFVAWTTETPAPGNGNISGINWLEHCQQLLFSEWQSEIPLRDCVRDYVAELKKHPAFRRKVPGSSTLLEIEQWKISGCNDLTTSDR